MAGDRVEHARRPPLAAAGHHRAPEAAGARGRTVEPLPPRERVRRRAHEPGIRPARRDHGPRALVERGLQLLGARHRQHGGAGALRHARAEEALARAAAGRRDPQRLRDDRAGGRLVGRHQHRGAHRAPRRPLRRQRPQVVDQRRRRSALRDLHLHGQDRPAGASALSAVDDPGATRHAGRRGAAAAHRVRLRRCPARPHGGRLPRRARAGVEHPARRGPRLRDRAGPPRAGTHPPLHAADRAGRALARADVPPRQRARRVRPHDRAADRDAGAHRRGALHDRAGAAAHAQGGVDDGWTPPATRARRPRSR